MTCSLLDDCSKVDVDGRAAKNNETVEAVAGAADRLLSAGISSGTNDGDGAAGQANLASDRPENNAEEASKETNNWVARRLDAVAALNATSVALRDGIGAGENTGRRAKGDEEEHEEGRDTSEHCELLSVGLLYPFARHSSSEPHGVDPIFF